MNLDKISDERLFLNNSKKEIKHWCQNLYYFHYMRARGGHNCEGDSFCVYFKYNGREDLIAKLKQLGVVINVLDGNSIAFDPFESYSIDDLDKLKMTIPGCNDLEQPQYVKMLGFNVHVWVMSDRFEISVSGTKDDKIYKVSESDFDVCLKLEKYFNELGWKNSLDEDIKSQIHCISKDKYPELF